MEDAKKTLWGTPPHQIFKPSYGPKQDARKSFEGKAEKIPDGLIRPSRTPLSCEVPTCLPKALSICTSFLKDQVDELDF